MILDGRYAEPKISLNRRVINTLLLLLLFRVTAGISILHVDEERMQHLLADNPLIGSVDLFAGGETLNHFSLVAAGIFPYLLALMLVQVAAALSPRLREMQRGEHDKERLEFVARIVSIPVALLFAWSLSRYLAQQVGLFPGHIHWFTRATFWPSLGIVSLVTLGSVLSTAISERISRKGLATGTDIVLIGGSSIVFLKQMATTVLGAPSRLVAGERIACIVLAALLVIIFSIYLINTQRQIPVQYAKRIVGRRIVPGQASYIPLPMNCGGIQPVSAAIGTLFLLQLARGFFLLHSRTWIGHVGLLMTGWIDAPNGGYWFVLGCLILFFTYLYNFSANWTEEPIAESLKKYGGYIPGLRPGSQTDAYLSRVVRAISFPGGLALAVLAAGVPYAILRVTHLNLTVTILSLFVLVTTVQSARSRVCSYRYLETYEGFFHTSRKKSLWDYLCPK